MFLLKVIISSLFIGMLVSWSGGSIFPALFNVAAPFVCNGKFSVETEVFRPRPGETVITQTALCTNPNTGKSTDISLETIVVAGLIYSAIVFVPVLVIAIRRRTREAQDAANLEKTLGALGSSVTIIPAQGMKKSEDPAEKLRKLKEMKDADLITEPEYESKRAEIISKM
ncbi:MAG: SHOCT domain-containing protein [Chloroflexi bacterium]|nr:SHOCT domain-containing protein [Chloroflexota bacterium]